MLTDVRIDNQTANPLGLVKAVKKCSCGALVWWCHYPGRPGEHEPDCARCRG